MTVKELVKCCYDTIIIYRSLNEDFEDLYNGKKYKIPADLLELNVKCFGAKKSGVLEIEIK